MLDGSAEINKFYNEKLFFQRKIKINDGIAEEKILKDGLEKYNQEDRIVVLRLIKKEELALIQRLLRRNGVYGLAEVYVRCREKGYKKLIIRRKSYFKYERMDGNYPGDTVQIDIKYVPDECICFPSYGNR